MHSETKRAPIVQVFPRFVGALYFDGFNEEDQEGLAFDGLSSLDATASRTVHPSI